MFEVWKDDKIRYWDLAPKLFPGTGEQQLVSFVGAGASVSKREPSEKTPQPRYPGSEAMQEIFRLVGLGEGQPRLYLEYAVRVALWMQAWETANGRVLSREEFIASLESGEYPPFGSELAELFSLLAPYRSLEDGALPNIVDRELLPPSIAPKTVPELVSMLQLLLRSTKVGSPNDPLTSISAYYEAGGERKDLWTNLHRIFRNKTRPTDIHHVIARAAQHHLDSRPLEDYLIITTNYDCLMEYALDSLKVPYAVLRPNRQDRKIHTRFANVEDPRRLNENNEPRYARDVVLKKGSEWP